MISHLQNNRLSLFRLLGSHRRSVGGTFMRRVFDLQINVFVSSDLRLAGERYLMPPLL